MTLLLNNLNPREIDTLAVFFDGIDVCYDGKTELFYIPYMKISWGDADDLNGGIYELCLDLLETLNDRSAHTPLSQIPIDNMMILIDYLGETEVEFPEYDAPDDEPCRIESYSVDRFEAGELGSALCDLKEYLHGLNAARGYLTIPNEELAA